MLTSVLGTYPEINVAEKMKHFLKSFYHFNIYNRCGWKVLFHSLSSPYLTSCDFHLILKMKKSLHEILFRTVPEILQTELINRTGAAKDLLQLLLRWQVFEPILKKWNTFTQASFFILLLSKQIFS